MYNNLAEFECQGQRSRLPGTKTKKCGSLFGSCPLGRAPRAAYFRERSSGSGPPPFLRRWENQRMLSSLDLTVRGSGRPYSAQLSFVV